MVEEVLLLSLKSDWFDLSNAVDTTFLLTPQHIQIAKNIFFFNFNLFCIFSNLTSHRQQDNLTRHHFRSVQVTVSNSKVTVK